MEDRFAFIYHENQCFPAEINRIERGSDTVFIAELLQDSTIRYEASTYSAAYDALARRLQEGGPLPAPLAAVADPVDQSVPVTLPTYAPLGRPARVLVVDDNPRALGIAVMICQNLGHRPLGARDGAEAAATLKAVGADVVLTDLHMPGSDGLSFLHWLRRFPAGARLPVIVVSAAGPRTLAAARDFGVAAVVKKPYDYKELAAALDAVVGPAHPR